MLLFINISTKYGGCYYDLFYFLAILFSLIALIIAGKKRNYPMIPWMLSILMILLFLILGTKIFTLSPGQWAEVFQHGKIPAHTGRTILGGIAGCITGLFISRLWFGFKNDIFDALSYIFPVAMAIQRVGCLFAGCCFGTPSNVPWAVVYSRNTYAHAAHVNNGLVDFYAPFSLPVHPNPIYQILACLIIILLLYNFFRKRIHIPGNLFLTSVMLYLISRVINEFWRDAASDGYAGNTVFGLKIVQWILAGVVTGLCIIILVREKAGKHKTLQSCIMNSEKRNVLFFFALFLMILFIWNWLPVIERLHILSVSLALGVISLIHGFRKLKGGRWQWSMIFLIPFSLGFVSWIKNDIPGTDNGKKDILSIGMGYTGGKYYFHYYGECATGDNCCERPVYYRKALYQIYGAGLSLTHFYEKGQKFIVGLNLSYGHQYEFERDDNHQTRSSYILGVNPRILYEGKMVGIGFGFQYGEYYTGYWPYNLSPQLKLRIGEPKYFHVSGKLGEQFPGIAHYNPVLLEIGTGFATDRFLLNGGFSWGIQNWEYSGGVQKQGFYIEPEIYLFKNHLTLQGYYTIFSNKSKDTPDADYNRFGFSAWYNFR